MINYIASKVCDEITYPFLNFNGVTEWKSDFIPTFSACNYLSMLGLK